MKTITKRLTIMILLIFSGIWLSSLMAQNFPEIIIDPENETDLTKMLPGKRDKKLKEIAWEVYKHPNVKDYYREYGTPTIEEKKTRILPAKEREKIANDEKGLWYGSKNGQTFYIVYFPYDKTKEQFDQNYAAKVYIWGDTGKPFAIGLGNMFRLRVRDGVPLIK